MQIQNYRHDNVEFIVSKIVKSEEGSFGTDRHDQSDEEL
jgi:hypothetical protein